MYRINAPGKIAYPEKELVLSILQKLGGEASVDEIYDLLDGSLSKDVITGVLCSQNQSLVKQSEWTVKDIISPVWIYIGPKQTFNFRRKRKRK